MLVDPNWVLIEQQDVTTTDNAMHNVQCCELHSSVVYTPTISHSRAAPAAAVHPARTMPTVSQGRVGSSTRSPKPALIPPSRRVPAQTRSVCPHAFARASTSAASRGACAASSPVNPSAGSENVGVYQILSTSRRTIGSSAVYRSTSGTRMGRKPSRRPSGTPLLVGGYQPWRRRMARVTAVEVAS